MNSTILNDSPMIGHLTREQSEAVLIDNIFGHIGINDGFNTYVYPTNYVFDGKSVYCHSFAGAKIKVMRLNKRVCLQVDAIKSISSWKSIMVHGNYVELTDIRDRYYAMKAFNYRMLHLKISKEFALHDAILHSLEKDFKQQIKPVIYRISTEEITGRYEDE